MTEIDELRRGRGKARTIIPTRAKTARVGDPTRTPLFSAASITGP